MNKMETTQALVASSEASLAPIRADIVAVPAWAVEEMDALILESRSVEITDAESFARADNLNASIRAWYKELEAHRVSAGKPFLDMTRSINAAAKAAAAPMAAESKELSAKIFAYTEKVEAEAQARREEEDAATRAKLEAERVEQEAELAEKNKLAAAAREKDADKKAKLEAEARADAQVRFDAAADAQRAAAAAEEVHTAPEDAPVKSTSVTTTTRKELVIEPWAVVPETIMVNRQSFTLLYRNIPNIKRALNAGASITGCYMKTTKHTRSL